MKEIFLTEKVWMTSHLYQWAGNIPAIPVSPAPIRERGRSNV
jgi:hypothetical protein